MIKEQCFVSKLINANSIIIISQTSSLITNTQLSQQLILDKLYRPLATLTDKQIEWNLFSE